MLFYDMVRSRLSQQFRQFYRVGRKCCRFRTSFVRDLCVLSLIYFSWVLLNLTIDSNPDNNRGICWHTCCLSVH